MSLKRSKLFFYFLSFLCAGQSFVLMANQTQERVRIKVYDGPDLPDDRVAVLAIDDFDYIPNSINGKDLKAILKSGTSPFGDIIQRRADLLLAPGVQTLAVSMDDYQTYDDYLRSQTIELAPGVELPAGRPTDIRALEGLESNTSIRFEALPGHRYRIHDKAIPLIKKDNILYFFHFTKLCVVEDMKGAQGAGGLFLGQLRECLNLRPDDEPKPVSADPNDAHLYDAENALPPESLATVRINASGLCVVEITGTTDDQQQIVCHASICGFYRTIHMKPGKYSFLASYSGFIDGAKATSIENATAVLKAEAGHEYELNAKISRGRRIWSIMFKEK